MLRTYHSHPLDVWLRWHARRRHYDDGKRRQLAGALVDFVSSVFIAFFLSVLECFAIDEFFLIFRLWALATASLPRSPTTRPPTRPTRGHTRASSRRTTSWTASETTRHSRYEADVAVVAVVVVAAAAGCCCC
jgi:hypothetical protein